MYLLLWRNWIAQLISTQWVGGSSPSRSVYGDCSSAGRAVDCGSTGRGFEPRHSPSTGTYMKLTDAELKKTLTVIEIDDCEYQHKLSVLGFVSGCKVCPLDNLGGTLLVDIKGCHYAMSKEIAEHINVEEER